MGIPLLGYFSLRESGRDWKGSFAQCVYVEREGKEKGVAGDV